MTDLRWQGAAELSIYQRNSVLSSDCENANWKLLMLALISDARVSGICCNKAAVFVSGRVPWQQEFVYLSTIDSSRFLRQISFRLDIFLEK